MSVISPDIATILGGALTALVTGLLAWLATRRKSRADFTVSLTSGFDILTARLQQDNLALREEVRQLRLEVADLRTQIEVANYRARGRYGGTPEWPV